MGGLKWAYAILPLHFVCLLLISSMLLITHYIHAFRWSFAESAPRPLISSAVASYLSFGAVLPGVSECLG